MLFLVQSAFVWFSSILTFADSTVQLWLLVRSSFLLLQILTIDAWTYHSCCFKSWQLMLELIIFAASNPDNWCLNLSPFSATVNRFIIGSFDVGQISIGLFICHAIKTALEYELHTPNLRFAALHQFERKEATPKYHNLSVCIIVHWRPANSVTLLLVRRHVAQHVVAVPSQRNQEWRFYWEMPYD